MNFKGLVLGVAFAVAACGGSSPAGSSSPAASPSAGTKAPATIKLALPVLKTAFAQSDIAIAEQNGFFKEQALTVTTENLSSGVKSVQAVVGGDADIGGASIEPVLNAAQRSAGLTIIGSYADRLPVVMETADRIKKPKDLRGQKLGIQDVGAFREVMTRAVYESAKLKPEDVQYVPTADTGYVGALLSGQIDSAILQAEQSVDAEQRSANVHVLADLYQIWPKYFYGTYFVKSEWLQSHRDVAVRFLTALTKAHRFIYSNRAATVSQVAASTGFSPQVIEKAYERIIVKDGVFAVNEGLQQDRLQFTVKKMTELNLLPGGSPDLTKVVDRGPIKDAVKQLGGDMTGDPRWH